MDINKACIQENVGEIATANISKVATVTLAGSAMLQGEGWKGAASGVVAGYTASVLLRSIFGGPIGFGTTLLLMGIGAAIGARDKD